MWVIRHIGVEIAFSPIHGDFTHETSIAKGPQSVIDRSQRHFIITIIARCKQAFSRNMAVLTVSNKTLRQNHALPRGAQSALE